MSFQTWLEKKELRGLEPTKAQLPVWKEYDVITLPPGVSGTNCGNCKFFKDNYCKNSHIKAEVTAHMCCRLWDRDDIKRAWGKMS